jgi:hypothetical protein
VSIAWFRQDKPAVREALRRGERPLMATTLASGPLDDWVALHIELGLFQALDPLPALRQRQGLDDPLWFRTLATLPFLEPPGLDPAARLLFQEPAILLQLGWTPAQIQHGDNHRHRHPEGRQAESLPGHPDTLRDAFRRVEASAWLQVQKAGVQSLFDHHLVRGKVYAIDGSGLGDSLPLVCLVCVSGQRPWVVAWRVLTGSASEKGKEASVTREWIEQAMAVGGPEWIERLLVDALDADGSLIAGLAYAQGIDVLVPWPGDRQMYADALGIAGSGMVAWKRNSDTRTIAGHKQRRTVETTVVGSLSSWDSFVAAAAGSGVSDASLWVYWIREVAPPEQPLAEAMALVSTRRFADGFAAVQAFRPRWHIENDNYREWKEGFGLEEQRWGRDVAAALCRTTRTLLAFNTTQVDRSRSGRRLAQTGIRRRRRQVDHQVGRAPAVVFLEDCDAVLSREELLATVGVGVRQGLLPDLEGPTVSSHPP